MPQLKDEKAGPGHNNPPPSKDEIAKLIRAHRTAHDEFDKKRKDLGGEVKKANQLFKAATGIDVGKFKAMRMLRDIQDDGLREIAMKSMQFCYNAMGDDQLDWIDAVDKEDGKSKPPPKAKGAKK